MPQADPTSGDQIISQETLLRREDIRIAYQSVVSFITYEGHLSWSVTSVFVQFAILLIAASVLPSFIGSTDARFTSITGFVLSLVGMVASIMWWSMVARTRKYYQYWLFTARELEQYMAQEIRTFERGFDLAVGGQATFKFPQKADHTGGSQAIQFKAIERIKMQTNFRILYGTFTAIFIMLAVLNIVRITQAF